jgi:hypothetical protein
VGGTKERESNAKPIVNNTKAYIDMKALVYSVKPIYQLKAKTYGNKLGLSCAKLRRSWD